MTTLQIVRAWRVLYGARVPYPMTFEQAAASILNRMGVRAGELFIASQGEDHAEVDDGETRPRGPAAD